MRSTSTIFHALYSPRLGGAAIAAIQIAAQLDKASRLGGVLIPGDGPAQQALDKSGLHSIRYNRAWVMSKNPCASALGNACLATAIQSWQSHIVHFHLPALYRASRFSLLRSKAVVHVQIEEPLESFRWAFAEPPELIVTCAQFLVPLVRHTLPKPAQDTQRIEVLPNAVDVDRLSVLRSSDKRQAKLRVGAPVDKPLLLMVANLASHKGQATAIEAVARLKMLGAEVECWLVGEDRENVGYADQLQELARRLAVDDRVKFVGFRSDVESYYAAADVLLLPSVQEGLPFTILEAQASGVPVIAAPTPGIREIVRDEETGWLREASDIEGYVQAIQQVLGNDAMRRNVTEAAFMAVKRDHCWSEYVLRMMSLYDSIAA